ncbi:hypothetical protein [Endozoicomonas sp. ONNA2]|uniref:hypothetical protein n=1 Tax=Endozoicomonas sp. ONNA2 TaxID=2828741 RepID=UPI002147A032|nr:hypothetical protein [Endozoicomonas sp. ONNA2]
MQKVRHPEIEVAGLPVAPHAKSGYVQNPAPTNCGTLMPGSGNPYPLQNTNIASRSIIPVSTVPAQFLTTPPMTGQPVAAVYYVNQPAMPLPQQHHLLNTLPLAIVPDTYDGTLYQLSEHIGATPVASAQQDAACLIPQLTNSLHPINIITTKRVYQAPEAAEFVQQLLPCAGLTTASAWNEAARNEGAGDEGAGDEGDSPVLSFSVQQVLQLKHPGTVRKTPHALKLLYLECFNFHQKLPCDEVFDEKGNRIKPTKSALKKQLKMMQKKLRENKIPAKITPLHTLKTMPSADVLLGRPTTYENMIIRSIQLMNAASSLEPDKFTEREKVKNSLAAHLASYNSSTQETRQSKGIINTKEAKKFLEIMEADDEWVLDLASLYYFPYFRQNILTLTAPFIRPTETIYCRPRLPNQLLMPNDSSGIKEQNDNQLLTITQTIHSLAKTLSIKLHRRVDDITPANIPETFSRQCIQWHIQFASDLIYKMIKLGDEGTQETLNGLAESLLSMLDSINTLSNYSSEFPDEFILMTESLCFLLQSSPLQRLLSQQEAEVPEDIKIIWLHTLEQLEKTILMILVKSFQYPELLNTSMCLLKTLADHEIYRKGQTGNNKTFFIRLARVTSEIARNLLTTLKSYFPDNLSTNDQFLEQLNSCCSIFNKLHQKIIQESNLVSTESQNLGDCIKTLHEACKIRRIEIEKAHQDYLNECEIEKKNNNVILRANMNKRENSKQKQDARNKRNYQLQQEITNAKYESLEKKEQLEADHAKLISGMGERLQLFGKKIGYGENYADELKTIDCEFPEIQHSLVLAVWVYGDIAYSVCNCADKFNRATLFVERFDRMKTFCSAALKEATAQAGKHDSKWLYDRNPDQPISISSIDFLTRLSDPEKIQALIKRAFTSISLYEVALDRARDATHQMTQDRVFDLVHEENDLQMYHLQQRVAFIIEEMNDVKQYLKDLQPVPDMSDLLATRTQLFKMLKRKVNTGSSYNQAREAKHTIYEILLEKSESEWKVDDTVCDRCKSAKQQLEYVIKGFKEIKNTLGS